MRRPATASACLACILTTRLGFADAALSAPYLGDQKYTIHLSGTLSDAVQELRKLTGRTMSYPAGPRGAPMAPGPGRDRGDTPVSLDFDSATLDKILLSLCEQAKLVYEPMGPSHIVLRDGDINLDSRPTVVVDDYTLRISEVQIGSSSRLTLRWGIPPGDPQETYLLSFQMDVSCKSLAARQRLAGLDPVMKGTTETGLVLESDPRRAEGFVQGWSQDPLAMQLRPSIAAPPEGPMKLVKLEGALRLYSDVKTTEIRIAPGDVGQTLQQDDCSVTVDAWQVTGGALQVRLQEKHPLLPRTPEMRRNPNNDSHAAVLIGKDGKALQSSENSSNISSAGNDGVYRLTFTFRPQGEVDYLKLTVVRRGPADKTLPFAFADVPLP